MNFCIYKITNKLNNKCYIGKTNNFKRRWINHVDFCKSQNPKKNNRCPKLYRAMRKYGIENFSIELIENQISDQEINNREIFWIESLKTIENGYNCVSGGQGGDTFTNNPRKDELRKIFSNNFKGRKHTIESKLKMSENRKGNKNPQFGKPSWNKGLVHTESHRKNLSINHADVKGEKAPNAKWKYILKSPIGVIHETNCLKDFCTEHKLNYILTGKLCNRRLKHYKEWTCIEKINRNNLTY